MATAKTTPKYQPKTPAQKGEEREIKMSEIIELKKKVTELEKVNDNFVIFYPSGKGFYKAIGHSALFAYFLMGEKTEFKRNLLVDRDDYYESEVGVVTVKNLDSLEKDAEKAGWKKYGPKESYFKNCICYAIPKVKSEDILKLRKEALGLKDKFNKILEVETDYTNGHDFMAINNIVFRAATIYRKECKANDYLKKPAYDILLKPGMELHNEYIELALEGRGKDLEWVVEKFDKIVELSLRLMNGYAIFDTIDGVMNRSGVMMKYEEEASKLFESLRGHRAKAVADFEIGRAHV